LTTDPCAQTKTFFKISTTTHLAGVKLWGAERFSKYEGCASGFHFIGAYGDTRCQNFSGRQETKIVTIDVLCY